EVFERLARARQLDERRACARTGVVAAGVARDRRAVVRERVLEPAQTHERVAETALEAGPAPELERARERGGGRLEVAERREDPAKLRLRRGAPGIERDGLARVRQRLARTPAARERRGQKRARARRRRGQANGLFVVDERVGAAPLLLVERAALEARLRVARTLAHRVVPERFRPLPHLPPPL